MPSRPRSAFAVACLAAAALSAGCRSESPAVRRSMQASDTLVDTRQSLVAGEQTVAQSQASLDALGHSNGDLRPAFAAFNAQLQAVSNEAARMAKQADLVRGQAAVYCTARKNDIETISDDDMRQAAKQRAQTVREQCDTINDLYGKVNSEFAAYARRLTDLQTYLANELNYATLATGQRWVDEAMASGEMLRGDIRKLALQVDLTSNALSPVPVAMMQWQGDVKPPDVLATKRPAVTASAASAATSP